MFIQEKLPIVSFGMVRKTILAVLIGLMGGGVAVLAQQTEAANATPAASASQPAPAAPAAASTNPPANVVAPGTGAAAAPDATATASGDAKPDAGDATIAIPTATTEAQREKEAQETADTQMDAATAKAVKKLADKFKGKKGKQPKLTPLDIEQGTLTVDGWIGKARMNYDIADLKFLYVWAPGVGTVVVSNGWFPQSDIQLNAFNGNTLTVTLKGHTIQIASDKRLLSGKKPESAFVYLDKAYQFPSAFPVMGYGASPLAPYAWPGATVPKGTLAGTVIPPPLPKELRPALAPPGCPPPGSKQAVNMTPCKLRVVPSATAAVAPAEATPPTP